VRDFPVRFARGLMALTNKGLDVLEFPTTQPTGTRECAAARRPEVHLIGFATDP
jgi:hypothetical protein